MSVLSDVATFLLFLVGLVVLLVVAALIADWRGRRTLRALGEPRLEVAPGPYALGDRVACRLTASARAKLRVEHATLALVCSEHVQWTETERYMDDHGEETRIARRATEEVWVQDQRVAAARDLAQGKVFTVQAEFGLPLDGPPTFLAPHNQVRWAVTFRAVVAKGPDAFMAEGIEVGPTRRLPGPPRA